MKLCTMTLSRIMIVLSVFTLSGCFVNEVKVTGSLEPSTLGLSDNILLQNTTTINVTDLDTTNFVENVSSLSIDITADCNAIDLSSEMSGFAPAVGEVNLDGRVLTAVNGLCVDDIYAESQKALYAQALSAQGLSNDFVFKSCTGSDTCENLKIAIFILEDVNNNTYGLQLEMLDGTATTESLTLLTLVGDGKLEYYGQVISNTNISSFNQIETAISTLLSLDIDVLDISNKKKKRLTKNLQEKGAVKDLEKALNPKNWSDENTLSEKNGDKVFTSVAKAIKKVLKAKKRLANESNDPSIQALLTTLNEIEANLTESMRALTANRIAEAQAANGNEKDIAKAIKQLEKGDAFVGAGISNKGIKKYRSSWRKL